MGLTQDILFTIIFLKLFFPPDFLFASTHFSVDLRTTENKQLCQFGIY